jgi:hypothetical protein
VGIGAGAGKRTRRNSTPRVETWGSVELYGFVRLHAREGEESAVEEALREVTGPTREETGCFEYSYVPVGAGPAVVFYSFAVGG